MIQDLYKLQTYDDETLKEISENFYNEIKLSSEGKKTSLPFIINPLPEKTGSIARDTFQAMVIGGSFFKSAVVKYINSGIVFLNKSEMMQPAFQTKQEFLAFIDQNLEKNVSVLALNFAYPVEPVLRDGKIDGVLKSGTKEQEFTGFIQKKVGLEIEEYIKIKQNRKIEVIVANDAVCLLLSGLDENERNRLAGGIVGTGLNFSFFLTDKKIVNLESGSFDKYPLSKEGAILDSRSSSPGTGLLEKDVSGRYLFEQYNLIADQKGSGLNRITSTQELSAIAENGNIPGSETARTLIERSAMLTAAQISGICKYKQSDMNFVMEGSLFWKGYNYKEQVSQFIELLCPGMNINFIYIEDSSLKGAAMLALL